MQQGPGGYTFYVGLRSNFACSLFVVSNYYYQIFFIKILKFLCILGRRIFRQGAPDEYTFYHGLHSYFVRSLQMILYEHY